jgi:hypothetical protein
MQVFGSPLSAMKDPIGHGLHGVSPPVTKNSPASQNLQKTNASFCEFLLVAPVLPKVDVKFGHISHEPTPETPTFSLYVSAGHGAQ